MTTATQNQQTCTMVTTENVTNDTTVTITESMLGIGEVIAQGDIYLVRLPSLPSGAKPRKNRQLADGDTQGSRHICTVGDVFDCDVDSIAKWLGIGKQYVGPAVRTVDGRAYIDHPEHGDHEYVGDMVLVCVFQRALDSEEREARVID